MTFKRLETFVALVFLIPVCGLDYYYTTSGGFKCKKCPPGYFVVKDCSRGSPDSTDCQPCPDDRYSPDWNMVYRCKECSTCKIKVHEVVVLACNKTHDITCGCEPGRYHENADDPSSSKCIPYRKCPEGKGVILPVPKYSDVSCEDCVEGSTFSDVESYSSCQNCTDCRAENTTSECTITSDTVCDIKTTVPPTTPSTSTHSTSTSVTPGKEDSTKLGPGAIAGIVLGVLVIAIIAIIVFVFLWRKCKTREVYHLPGSTVNSPAALQTWQRTPGVGGPAVHATYNEASEPNGVTIYLDAANGTALWHNAQQARDQHPPRHQGTNEVDDVPTERTPFLPERSLQLNPKLEILPHDINVWISQHLGGSYSKFIKKLPGQGLTQTEWDEPSFDRMKLKDTIVNLLETWKEKNPEIQDNEVLSKYYWAASAIERTDICDGLRKEFAVSDGDDAVTDGDV